MRGLLGGILTIPLVAALVVGTSHDAVAQEAGTWALSDGSMEPRRCLRADEYGETTPIPQGCPVLLTGGGILYTRLADSQVAGELRALTEMGKQHRLTVVRLETLIKTTTRAHKDKIASLAKQCDTCATELEKAPTKATLWLSLSTGFAVGVALMATVMVLN